jgi:hypothetical protein
MLMFLAIIKWRFNMFVTKKSFMMFDLRQKNKIIAFMKRNPGLVMLVVGMAVGLFMPDAYAGELDFLGKKLKDKIQAISDVMLIVGGAGCLVGVAWLVISLLRGEFNYRLAGCLVAGGGLLAVAGRVGQWVAK